MTDVTERRLESLKLEGMGLSQPEIVKQISEKFQVSAARLMIFKICIGFWCLYVCSHTRENFAILPTPLPYALRVAMVSVAKYPLNPKLIVSRRRSGAEINFFYF